MALAAGGFSRPAVANGDFKSADAGMMAGPQAAYPSMSSLAGHMSGSSVQVFSLDDMPYGSPAGGMTAPAYPAYGNGYGMGYSGGMDMSGAPVYGAPMAAGGDSAVTVYPMAGMAYGGYYAGGAMPYAYEGMYYAPPAPRPYLSPAARQSMPSIDEQKLLMKLPPWMKPIPRGYSR